MKRVDRVLEWQLYVCLHVLRLCGSIIRATFHHDPAISRMAIRMMMPRVSPNFVMVFCIGTSRRKDALLGER